MIRARFPGDGQMTSPSRDFPTSDVVQISEKEYPALARAIKGGQDFDKYLYSIGIEPSVFEEAPEARA
jgi:hypothetical protein